MYKVYVSNPKEAFKLDYDLLDTYIATITDGNIAKQCKFDDGDYDTDYIMRDLDHFDIFVEQPLISVNQNGEEVFCLTNSSLAALFGSSFVNCFESTDDLYVGVKDNYLLLSATWECGQGSAWVIFDLSTKQQFSRGDSFISDEYFELDNYPFVFVHASSCYSSHSLSLDLVETSGAVKEVSLYFFDNLKQKLQIHTSAIEIEESNNFEFSITNITFNVNGKSYKVPTQSLILTD